MKALVLGCGPSGLIAAHTLSEFGAEVQVASRGVEKSIIYGAQFLYEPIPGLSSPHPDGMLHNIYLGDVETYREKIYGDPTIKTTWDNKEGAESEPVWSLHSTYSMLWERYRHRIHDMNVTPDLLPWKIQEYDLVVSSIPANAICVDEAHVFSRYKVRILRQSHQQRLLPGDSNICIYNGLREDTWFRFSHMFGQNGGFEFPIWNISEGSVVISKPTVTDCDCWPQILRVGRYGRWDMKTNTHHSWAIVEGELSGSHQQRGSLQEVPDPIVPST